MLVLLLVAVCPKCQGKFQFALRQGGQVGCCPHCKIKLRLPINLTPKEGECK